MDILKSFVLDGTEHSVNVLWEDDTPFFRATEIGQILGLLKIRNTISDFDIDERVEKDAHTNGGLQKTSFLTESGLYRLLMISRKPIARPFQKWVSHIIITIRKTGKYEVQKYMEEIETLNGDLILVNNQLMSLQKEANHFKDIAQKSTHQSYIEAYANKYVVYFGRIRSLDSDLTLIKIGSTKDIRTRAVSLKAEFGNMEIFKVIDCPCNEMFERFLHNHKDIQKHAYKDVIHEGHRSHEVFALNTEELIKTINIALHNVYRFRNMVPENFEIEMQKMKFETIKEFERVLQIAQTNSNPTVEIIKKIIDPTYVDPILRFADNRQHTQAKGSKIQRYSPDGKTLLKTYESSIAALRDISIDSPSRTRIHEAVKSNTVYKDFRWMLLDRQLPDDTLQVLEKTVEKSSDIRKGFVAMLNLEKTHIVEVFQNQKEAAENRKFGGSAPICAALKKRTQSGGHYFQMWFECSEVLQDEFLSRKTLPQKITPGGQRISQMHPVTGEVIKVYASVSDVIKEYRFSRASLFNVIENKFISKGYQWAFE
jgi:prophage antirepressor-like protein